MDLEKHVETSARSLETPPEDSQSSPLSNDYIVKAINASGHVQELDRSFGLWSTCNIGIAVDNAWAAGSGALVVALANGGPPGVIYEFIAACILYFPIGACLAELASAIPSSANVYHWASVTAGPKFGRVCSWYAGWWNVLAWTFGTATAATFAANVILGIYSLFHNDFVPQRWQIFIAYVGVTWLTCSVVLFGQRFLPYIANFSGIACMVLGLVTLLVCAIMPSFNGHGHASHSFVWTDWQNQTGYSSSAFVFFLGMLNGAYAIGTPDGCTHLAEEIPDPRRNLPKGILAQLVTGTVSTLCFYIAILYAITDLDQVINSNLTSFPLGAIYYQATRSHGGTAALLALFLFNTLMNMPACYVTAGRMLWTLARDDAVPFASHVGKISSRFHNPFAATICIALALTGLGCIYIASATAFNAFVGSFTILTTLSYVAAILPHLLSRRRFVKPGPFWMPTKYAYPVMFVASAYILVFDVIYCFPFSLPTSAETMNYSSVMSGGLTLIVGVYYLWKRNHGYKGPQVAMEIEDDEVTAVLRPPSSGREKDIRLTEAETLPIKA